MQPIKQAQLWIIIPCAGVGSRVGADIPKQYLPLHTSTVLEQTLERFICRDDVAGIVLAIADNDGWIKELPLIQTCLKQNYGSKIYFTHGGKERSDSVTSALQFLSDELQVNANDLVAIHDAARPCVNPSDLDAVFSAARQHDAGALLAVPSVNTLKRTKVGKHAVTLSEQTVDRSIIWQAHTPQVFRFDLIQSALHHANTNNLDITDDASAVELLDKQPILVEGSACNIKITKAEDLALAEFYLQQMS